MFTFILFILLSGLCLIIYIYFSNQLVMQRKQIMLLTNQNAELRRKLNKLKENQVSAKVNNETNTESRESEEFGQLEDE